MICDNGIYREETPEEISRREADAKRRKAEYWKNTPYADLVVAEIRKYYTLNQELAIQRQRDEKPEEFRTFYSYCEHCKASVKSKLREYGIEIVDS